MPPDEHRYEIKISAVTDVLSCVRGSVELSFPSVLGPTALNALVVAARHHLQPLPGIARHLFPIGKVSNTGATLRSIVCFPIESGTKAECRHFALHRFCDCGLHGVDVCGGPTV